MATKSAILKGLPAVQAHNLTDGIIFGAVKQAIMDNESRTMKDIAKCVMANFGIEGVTPGAILSTYYRMQKRFLGKGYAEDDTAGQPQTTE
jgi:diphthamide synthase (EF-2-diphthine--ammonia ligase)